MLQLIPKVGNDTVKSILEVLPEPSKVKVRLYGRDRVGKFSFTSVFEKNFPFEIEGVYPEEGNVKNPSKSVILDLLYPKEEFAILPRMDFNEAEFKLVEVNNDYLKEPADVKLSMYKLEITYTRFEDARLINELLMGMDTSEIELVITKLRKIYF